MPKAVDIYVLDKKIGAGQFGDVYKGYSKVDGSEVAIKTIKRDRVKGNSFLILKANSPNSSITKFKSSNPAEITTSFASSISRRLLITFT